MKGTARELPPAQKGDAMKTVHSWAGVCALGLSLAACAGPAESNPSAGGASGAAGEVGAETPKSPPSRPEVAAVVPSVGRATLRFHMRAVR
jgi:hypothetical protein